MDQITNPQRRVLQLMGTTGTISLERLRREMPTWFRPLCSLLTKGLVEHYGTGCYCLTQKATPFMPEIMG